MALKKYYEAKGPKSQCKWIYPIMMGNSLNNSSLTMKQ